MRCCTEYTDRAEVSLLDYTMSQVQRLYKVYRVGRSILLDHSMRGEKMNSFFHEAVEENPIIAAVKNMDDLKICCSLEDIRVVFILFGDVCSIREIVEKVKESGKVAMVHIDLISGLSSKEIVVDFIRKNTEADGIISTKAALIKRGEPFMAENTICFSLNRWAQRLSTPPSCICLRNTIHTSGWPAYSSG